MDTLGYCVRIDAMEGYLEKIKALPMCQDYKSIVAVRHHGTNKENPHYHLVVQTPVLQQAFRVRLRKIFDQAKGNGHMSIKPWDGNNDAISYLFHEDENAKLLVQHNVTDETIKSARERNKSVQLMVQAAKDKASWKLEDLSYEYFKNEWKPVGGQSQPSEATIGQHLIINALRTGKYVPQPWLIKAMVQRIQFKLLDGNVESEEEFAMRLSRQIFYRDQ